MKASVNNLVSSYEATRIYDPTGGSFARRHHKRSDDGHAFLADPMQYGRAQSSDETVNELARDYLLAATSGEETTYDLLDQETEAERGGPFVEESGENEFADDWDESNPADATREPLPSPMRGL